MKTTKHRLLGLAVLASTALPSIAAAQAGTGGFQFGDLYLNTPAWSGPSSADGAIVRIDPVTGQSTLLHDLAASGPMTQGITYDPFRDRLLFFGGFVPNTLELWASDASGNLQSLGMQTVSGGSRGLLTPRGDGIVYLLDPTNPSVLSYLDAQNQVHTLMDASARRRTSTR